MSKSNKIYTQLLTVPNSDSSSLFFLATFLNYSPPLMGGDKGEGVLSRLILYHNLRSASVIFFLKHRARSERNKTEEIDYHPLLSPPPLRGRE